MEENKECRGKEKQNKHQLIILRGNSGSGKSTIAKMLQEKFGGGTLMIAQDVVRRDMLKTQDGAQTKALPLLEMLLQYGKKQCRITILEGILRADWYRPLFELAVKEFGSEIYAYYFDLPFEETLKRHKTKPNHKDFGEDAMKSWWREQDLIGLSCIEEKRIQAQDLPESIVKRIQEDLVKHQAFDVTVPGSCVEFFRTSF